MVTLINQNNSVDTFYELFIVLAVVLFGLVLLCKIGSFFDKLPVKESKPKKSSIKDSKSQVKIEEKKELKENYKEKIEPVQEIVIDTSRKYESDTNYLYDRFVSNPSKEDVSERKSISDAFITNEEQNSIKNYNVKIDVKDNEEDSKKVLYNRINQMTSSNMETRERLLKEFEGLSKEMKLLLIDNIIQKM